MKPCIEMHRRSCPGPSDHSRWSSRSPAICDDFPKAPVGFAEARHDLATKGGKMGKDGKGRQKFTCAMLGFNGINNIGIIIYCNIYDNHL